jgi:hypothetical protein
MNKLVLISRNFVEFGAFTPAEVLDFQKRGIVQPTDFACLSGDEIWQPAPEFISALAPGDATPVVAKKTVTRAKAPTKKKSAAK